MQLLTPGVEVALAFGEQERAVLDGELRYFPIEERLQPRLAWRPGDLGLRNIGGPVRVHDEVDLRVLDHDRPDIDVRFPKGNDLQHDLDRAGRKQRWSARRLRPAQGEAAYF